MQLKGQVISLDKENLAFKIEYHSIYLKQLQRFCDGNGSDRPVNTRGEGLPNV